jgi:F-type H+-transporting ATPase subunit delta
LTGEETTISGVGGRYATALFELARDAGQVDQVENDLGAVSRMLDESPDLRRLVSSPAFTSEQQIDALQALLARAGVKDLAAKFIMLVARNRRLFALNGMIAAFRQLAGQERGAVSAEVTSAETLKDAQVAELKKALKEKLGQDVELSLKVDPALLGGLVVKVGSRMIDSSLRTRLRSLKNAMKEVG